jgi:tricorn protease-like protein
MRNTFCLKSVSSSKDISASQLNTSTSKNLWSFSKDSRFKNQIISNLFVIPVATASTISLRLLEKKEHLLVMAKI